MRVGDKEVLVGTCGFNRARKLIFSNLDVVEIQQTFYDPPPPDRLKKIRAEAPPEFEFTVKAWMLITHPYNKLLWRRLKRSVLGTRENYGFFKDTREVEWAWRVTVEAAESVGSRIIVLQSPASFKPVPENISRLKGFLERHSNEGFQLVWEPRGEWWKRWDLLEEISREYSLVIAGDFLRNRIPPYHPGGLAYTRLHGLGGREVNYKYKYSDDDLEKLKNIILKLKTKKIYILFNNIYSFDDAVRFKTLLQQRKSTH